MKIAAMILGIIGGLAGLGGAVFALFLGGIGGAFGAAGAGLIAKLGFLAIPFSILGIVGGALANTRPGTSGFLMLASALGGVISISLAYSIAAILLLSGGIFSLIESRKVQPASSQPLAAPNEEDLTTNSLPWYRRKTTWAAVAAVLILPVVFSAAAGSRSHNADLQQEVRGTIVAGPIWRRHGRRSEALRNEYFLFSF